MAKSYLVLDLETVPDPDLYTPPEVPAGGERPFPPTYAHRIILMGALWLREDYRLERLGLVEDGAQDEARALGAFSQFMARHTTELVTYNGRKFDLPVIVHRSLRHGVPLPWFYGRSDFRYRYSFEGHIDLCDVLSEHGATRPISLDAAARLIGLPGKTGLDGSQVEGLYHAGQLEALKSYCLSDVVQTAFLFLRFRLLMGALDPDGYRRAAAELREALARDGRVADVVETADDPRLLLSE